MSFYTLVSVFIMDWLIPGVHNAKAEECTTPYMRRNIKYIGVGGCRTTSLAARSGT